MNARALTVADALRQARESGVDRLDAQLLLARIVDRPRSWLLAHDDAELESALLTVFQGLLGRRAAGEPIAYLLGEKEFHGLTLQVDANVLIPRPDTEALVDWAIDLLAGELSQLDQPKVLDLGTGSGAIALAIKRAHPSALVVATDLDAKALDVARANATRLQLDVTFLQSSWWGALDGHRFDLVLSNPPYIAGGDPHLAALRYEPQLALTPGGDGLRALQEIIAVAREHLEPARWLLLEHGYDQADAVNELLQMAGFGQVQARRDLAGQTRCSGGRS